MDVTGSSYSTRSPGGRGPRGGAKNDFALALGVERLGLVSLSHPWIIAFAAIALMIAAGFGVGRLKVDNSLSQLFRSKTPQFRQYEDVTTRFPSNEYDVLIVVEGKDLLAREIFEKLRDFVTDLNCSTARVASSRFFPRVSPRKAAGFRRRCFPNPCRKERRIASLSSA